MVGNYSQWRCVILILIKSLKFVIYRLKTKRPKNGTVGTRGQGFSIFQRMNKPSECGHTWTFTEINCNPFCKRQAKTPENFHLAHCWSLLPTENGKKTQASNNYKQITLSVCSLSSCLLWSCLVWFQHSKVTVMFDTVQVKLSGVSLSMVQLEALVV